jgi:hypothetical protein
MRFGIRLGLAFATSVALVAAVTPAAFASSTTQQATAAHVVTKNGHLALAIPLRPGTHKVSSQFKVHAPAPSPGAAPSAAPTIQIRVGPSACAGYNGEINWVYFPNSEAWLINTYGVLWDNCWRFYARASTVYVYVSYNELDEPRQNFQAFSLKDSSSPGISKGVNSGEIQTADIFGPSAIQVDACLSSVNGWECGKGQSI